VGPSSDAGDVRSSPSRRAVRGSTPRSVTNIGRAGASNLTVVLGEKGLADRVVKLL
jgi:hypothetical protein